jgi:type III restriction enzyme
MNNAHVFSRTDPFALAHALTRKTRRLCTGLDSGEADIFELVTPTTAGLLRWWFGERACGARALNFLPAQRQAILNTVVSHEVFGAPTLRSLYEIAAPAALSVAERLLEIIRPRYFHPSYCIGAGPGSVLVLQALLIWQVLNKTAALRQGRDDSRFTQHFLLVAPHDTARNYLRTVFAVRCGDAERIALLMPDGQREFLLDFWRNRVCGALDPMCDRAAAGMLALASRPFEPSAHALGIFAAQPDLMLFDAPSCDREGEGVWQKTLTRMAANKGRRFVRVDFLSVSRAAGDAWRCPAHLVADLGAPDAA